MECTSMAVWFPLQLFDDFLVKYLFGILFFITSRSFYLLILVRKFCTPRTFFVAKSGILIICMYSINSPKILWNSFKNLDLRKKGEKKWTTGKLIQEPLFHLRLHSEWKSRTKTKTETVPFNLLERKWEDSKKISWKEWID